jgi:hypothetical protein
MTHLRRGELVLDEWRRFAQYRLPTCALHFGAPSKAPVQVQFHRPLRNAAFEAADVGSGSCLPFVLPISLLTAVEMRRIQSVERAVLAKRTGVYG